MSRFEERGGQNGPPRRKRQLKPNILIVDADAMTRGVMAVVARDEGHIVAEAADASVAMRILDVGISVVASDLQLTTPSDGLELLQAVNDRWPDVSLIGTSAELAPYPGVFPAGAMFASKPFRLNRLTHLLREAA